MDVSAGAVGVAAVGDQDDGDDVGVVVNAVKDPVCPASGAESVIQRGAEPAADAVGILE